MLIYVFSCRSLNNLCLSSLILHTLNLSSNNTHGLTLSLSLSLSHTHTHTLSLLPSPSLTLSLSLPLSLSKRPPTPLSSLRNNPSRSYTQSCISFPFVQSDGNIAYVTIADFGSSFGFGDECVYRLHTGEVDASDVSDSTSLLLLIIIFFACSWLCGVMWCNGKLVECVVVIS